MSDRELHTVLDIHEGNDLVIKWRLTDMCNYRCSYCLRKETLPLYRREAATSIREKEEELCDVARALNKLLLRNPDKKSVKINLIGGEVSLFDLERILGRITATSWKNSQMTTNLSRPVDYYTNLYKYLQSRGVKLTTVVSFHPEYRDMDTFFEKAAALNEGLERNLRVEMVSTPANQALCREFKCRAETLGLKYMIDIDMRLKELDARMNQAIMSGGNVEKKTRYLVYLDDGTEESYITRNDFLRNGNTGQNVNKKSVRTTGYYCSNSYDYLYIENGYVIGRFGKTKNSCAIRIPMEDFELLPEPLKCLEAGCSLCGNCSISRDKQILLDYKKIIDKLDREE